MMSKGLSLGVAERIITPPIGGYLYGYPNPPKSTLSKITRKNVIPNICTLHSICKGLNITLSDFFFGSEDATPMTFKEAKPIERFRTLSPMSQDTLIKLAKCMR